MDNEWCRFLFLLSCFSLSKPKSCTFQVIKQTEEFEKSLKDLEFLQRDSTDLLKYARDVNCHFASKKCKDVIVAARKLMTSKMHNTVKVSVHSGVFSFESTVHLYTCHSKFSEVVIH